MFWAFPEDETMVLVEHHLASILSSFFWLLSVVEVAEVAEVAGPENHRF